MKTILKFFKRKRLLKKYELTEDKMLNQIHLKNLMKDDEEFIKQYLHIIYSEIRCYNRLKKLN